MWKPARSLLSKLYDKIHDFCFGKDFGIKCECGRIMSKREKPVLGRKTIVYGVPAIDTFSKHECVCGKWKLESKGFKPISSLNEFETIKK